MSSSNNNRLKKNIIENTSNLRFTNELTLKRKNIRDSQVKKFRVPLSSSEPDENISLSSICENLNSPADDDITQAIHSLQRLLASNHYSIHDLVNMNIFHRLLIILSSSNKSLVVSCLMCLSNLASGDHEESNLVIQALPKLMEIFQSDDLNLKEQVCWVLGNISGDCDECRNHIKSMCFLSVVNLLTSLTVNMTRQTTPLETVVCWVMSNLLRGHTLTAREFLTHCPMENFMIYLDKSDSNFLTEVAWMLTFLSAKMDFPLHLDLNMNLLNKIMILLMSIDVDHPGCVPLLISGTNFLFQEGFTKYSPEIINVILKYSSTFAPPNLRKESLRLLRVLVQNDNEHTKIIRDNSFIMTNLLSCLLSDIFDVRKDSLQLITVMYSSRCPPQIISSDVIEVLVNCLREHDVDVQYDSMILLESIALLSSDYLDLCVSCGVLDAIDDIQYGNYNPNLVSAARVIADKLYNLLEESEEMERNEPAPPMFCNSFQQGIGRGSSINRPAWMK